LSECQSALKGLGPSIYKPDANAPKTSPFKKGGANGQSTTSNNGSAVNRPAFASNTPWKFSESEEDWGKTCSVETTAGNIRVGFMGSPGKDLVGYVDGLFEGDTKADWQVDQAPAVTVDGGQDDYFGWHGFYNLGEGLLLQVAVGKELSVGNVNDRHVLVGLQGAAQAVPAFMACFHTSK
jgi:hypothetical protein